MTLVCQSTDMYLNMRWWQYWSADVLQWSNEFPTCALTPPNHGLVLNLGLPMPCLSITSPLFRWLWRFISFTLFHPVPDQRFSPTSLTTSVSSSPKAIWSKFATSCSATRSPLPPRQALWRPSTSLSQLWTPASDPRRLLSSRWIGYADWMLPITECWLTEFKIP